MRLHARRPVAHDVAEGIAPCAGAWIETSVTFAYIPALMVVPARARAAILRVAIFASGSIGFSSRRSTASCPRALSSASSTASPPQPHLIICRRCRDAAFHGHAGQNLAMALRRCRLARCCSARRSPPSSRRPSRSARPWSANARTGGAARLAENLVRGGEDAAMSYPRCAFRQISNIESGRSQITFPANCERPNPADREHRFRARYSWCEGEPVPLTVWH